jgi:hypothetical protein
MILEVLRQAQDDSIRIAPPHPRTPAPPHPRTPDPLTRSPAHPLTRSPAHPLTRSPAHPLTHSPTHPLTHSPTHPSPPTKSPHTSRYPRYTPCLSHNPSCALTDADPELIAVNPGNAASISLGAFRKDTQCPQQRRCPAESICPAIFPPAVCFATVIPLSGPTPPSEPRTHAPIAHTQAPDSPLPPR